MSDNKNIDFGVDIDIASLLDDISSVQSTKSKDAKKSTLKEKPLSSQQIISKRVRDLNNAVTKRDFDTVKRVFLEDKDILDNVNPPFFSNKLMDNFDPEITTFIMQHGFSIPIHTVSFHILNKRSVDLAKFFIDEAKKSVVDNSDYEFTNQDICIDKKEALSIFQSKAYDLNWNFTLLKLIINKKNDKQSQIIADYIIKSFPGILDTSISYPSNLLSTILSLPKDSGWHKDLLSSLDLRAWADFFETSMKTQSFSYIYGSARNFNMQSMNFILDILRENKEIRKIWNDAHKNNRKQHKDWKHWIDENIPEDIDFNQTPLVNKLSRVQDDPKLGSRKQTLLLEYTLSDIQAGFDVFERIVMNRNSTLYKIDFTILVDKLDKNERLFEKSPPSYVSPSFMHAIIASGSSLLSDLLKEKEGQKMVAKCLQDTFTLFSFLRQAPTDIVCNALKNSPKLTKWTDINGNTAAHIHVNHSFNISKKSAIGLFRACGNNLSHKNKDGISVLDMFMNKGIDEDMVFLLNSMILKSEIKKDETVAQKIRSRTKHSAPKRKI